MCDSDLRVGLSVPSFDEIYSGKWFYSNFKIILTRKDGSAFYIVRSLFRVRLSA